MNERTNSPICPGNLDPGSASEARLFDKLKWMNSKEAAFYLRISVSQLRNMVYRGQVRSYRLQGRLRFLRGELDSQFKPCSIMGVIPRKDIR